MLVLGIDPGFGITGYGIIEIKNLDLQNPKLIEAGILRSQKTKSLSERLQEIYDHIIEILNDFKPEGMAIEEVYSSKSFPRSGIQIGNVQGIVLLAAAQKKISISTYFPIQVKKALLGHGHATKIQMQKMIQRTLHLETVPQPDDAADALAVALCHAQRMIKIVR